MTDIVQFGKQSTESYNTITNIALENINNSANDLTSVRKDVIVQNDKNGNQKVSIINAFEEGLSNQYIKSSSSLSMNQVISSYTKEILHRFGDSENPNSLHNLYGEVTEALKSNWENSAIGHNNVVQKLNKFTKKFNELDSFLKEKSAEVDDKIAKEIVEVNQLLSSIDTYTKLLKDNNNNKSGEKYASAQNNIVKLIENLGKKFEINSNALSDGSYEVHLCTDSEINKLIGNITRQEFSYKSLTIDQIKKGDLFNPIKLQNFGYNDGQYNLNINAIDLTNSESGHHKIKGGSMGGLLKVRDEIIKDTSNALNELASEFMEFFNSIHRDLTPYPSHSDLTGDNKLKLDTALGSSGKVKIGVLDKMGKPISINGSVIAPLDLDMSELARLHSDSGSPNVQTVLTKINDYFSIENRRVEISNLNDLKLISKSKGFDPNGVNFGVELTSANDDYTHFKINALRITDGNNNEIQITSSAIGKLIKIPGGTKQEIFSELDFNFTPKTSNAGNTLLGSPHYPYKVEIDVMVQSQNDINPTYSKVSYEIQDTHSYANSANGILGKSFSANNISNSGFGDSINFGEIKNGVNILEAKLIDDNKEQISDSNAIGSLKIASFKDQYRIAIIEDNKEFDILLHNSSKKIKGSFNAILGLNNFLYMNKSQTNNYNAARAIAIKPEIIKNPKLFSYTESTPINNESHNYEISLENKKIYNLWSTNGKDFHDSIVKIIVDRSQVHTNWDTNRRMDEGIVDETIATLHDIRSTDAKTEEMLVMQSMIQHFSNIRILNMIQQNNMNLIQQLGRP